MRIRINQREIELLIKAMIKADYNKERYFSDEYTLLRRFRELR